MVQKIKQMFKSVDSKRGGYSVGVTVIVLAIVIVANLIIGKLPDSAVQKDISTTNIYSVSDTTTNLLSGLTDDVKIVVLGDPQSIDARITTFLNKYASLSSHLSLETVDTVLHPTALTQYNADDDSVVVTCDATGKSTTISFDSILQYDEMSYYYYGTKTYTSFDGEGQLTSAVNYVTSSEQNIVYLTSGHGESSLASGVTDLMTKANIKTEELNLLTVTSIPDDCNLLLMYGPTSDITSDEAKVLQTYLENGGKMMMLLGAAKDETPNINTVLNEYGLNLETGYVEDTSRCYQSHPYAIIPNLSVTGDLANSMTSDSVLLYASMGMTQVDPARDTISVTTFMNSSANASLTKDDGTVLSSGKYVLGAYATESSGTDTSTDTSSSESTDTASSSRLTVVSGYALIDSNITSSFSSLGNLTLFMNLVSANFSNSKNVSISSKSLSTTYNTVTHPGYFSILFIFLIPLAFLIFGFTVWLRRRKA